MPTLVERLQIDAADPSVRVATLLRRAKISAKKLGLKNVEDWIESELNGYSGPVPEYRKIFGMLMGWNPYHGWIPIGGNDSVISQVSSTFTAQSVDELESLIVDRPDAEIAIELPNRTVMALNTVMNVPLTRYTLQLGRTDITRILNAVRNAVLDWSLSLEEYDITGSEFSFSPEERNKAGEPSVSIRIDSIGSFNGNLGTGNVARNITSSQIDVEQVRRISGQLRPALASAAFSDVERRDIGPLVDRLEEAVGKAHPEQSKVRSALHDVRNALSGAAGNIVASGFLAEIGKLFGG